MDQNLLQGLGAQGDPAAQQKAMQYFEQLKNSPDGWKLCAATLTNNQLSDEYSKFFCFQVIEHFLKTRYECSSNSEDATNIKNLLLTWLQMQNTSGTQDKAYLRNKAGQIFSLAFVVDFPRRWPSFFTDLLQTLCYGDKAVDMFLRILLSIDSEVVDRDIAHTPQEAERNNNLKDAMRVSAVQQLVDSWYQIITTYETSHPEVTCQCLEVIGAYISWIDISLIANDRFVTVLLRFMSNPLLRESACDCIHEIISKGMEPMAKAELIESFLTVLKSANIFTITEEDDCDYLAKLSKLVNGLGVQLITGWQKLTKASSHNEANALMHAIETKVPLMFQFLAHEDDDVSGAVAKFAHDYVSVLKQLSPHRTEAQKENTKNLLFVVIQKMKYDESYSFETEGEEEAMFQEYRKELKIIFNNIGALDSELVMQTVHELVTTNLPQWQHNATYQDLEIAITLLYHLAEAIPPIDLSGTLKETNADQMVSMFQPIHGQQYFNGDSTRVRQMQEMVALLVTSRVSCFQHTAVWLQYFETIVRYDKFFNLEPQYIPDVMMSFVDERGLRNPRPQVCSRISYLFSRFVKDINKQHLDSYLDTLLKQIQELLVLNTPDNGVRQTALSSEDLLFLYETAGILVIQSSFAPEKKQECMHNLLAPIVSKFDGLLQGMASSTAATAQLAYAESLSQAMAFASRTSKGFSSQQTMKASGCVQVYTQTLGVFLHALNTPIHRQLLHAGVRQFLHRMVVCMEAEVLPFIPMAMEHLLKNADAKELHDFIPLINQVISKFKVHIAPFLQEVFMPIVQTIFAVLQSPADDQDQVAATDKKMLHRGYFSFISNLVNNNVTQVLSNQDMQNLHQVLLTIIHGAVEIPDPTGQKSCFAILRRLVELWGGKDGLAGFGEFMYDNIIPACFMAPMKPSFDLTDAQTVLVLNECAACLKTAVDKGGDEVQQFLQTKYLPSLNVSQEIIVEFCTALKSDHKAFRNYYKSFFLRART